MKKSRYTTDKTPERKVLSYEKKPIAKTGREILALCNQIAAAKTIRYSSRNVDIITLYKAGHKVKDIAQQYGLCTRQIQTIIHRGY